MLGVNEAINGIYQLIVGDKQFSDDDFVKVVSTIIHNTIFSVQLEFINIVDRNNIVMNIDDIKKEIDVLIDKKVNEGRLSIKSFNFKTFILEEFANNSNDIVNESKKICKELFEEAAADLQKLVADIEENECVTEGKILLQKKERIYTHLKRGLYSTAQELGYEMEMMINKVGGEK